MARRTKKQFLIDMECNAPWTMHRQDKWAKVGTLGSYRHG